MKSRILFLLLAALLLTSCSSDNSSDIMPFSRQDPEMNAAIQKAQDTLDDFVRNLQNPQSNQRDFLIKARFRYGQDNVDYEHIWITDVTYAGDTFQGRIDNDVVYVDGLKYGDSVTVQRSDISDWMYVENGKLVGGYTYRVMRNRMSPEQRERSDKAMELAGAD